MIYWQYPSFIEVLYDNLPKFLKADYREMLQSYTSVCTLSQLFTVDCVYLLQSIPFSQYKRLKCGTLQGILLGDLTSEHYELQS